MKMVSLYVLIGVAALNSAVVHAEKISTGADVVSMCEYKNPGKDQISKLAIELTDKDGRSRKNVYARLWKNYYGEDDVVDKMVLYTVFPPDAKGTGFMRWGYKAEAKKMADQWLYLPSLRKIRRVSVRDPGDSFLGSDLSYGDIDERAVSDDAHKLLGMQKIEGSNYYVVESRPLESEPLYSKKVSWYRATDNVEDCVRSKTDYYDIRGSLLKKQDLSWQKVQGAWAWDEVVVKNVQNGHKSVFKVTDVRVAVGLKDKQFTERGLKKGAK